MSARKAKPPPQSADDVRRDVIRWFYDLNKKGGAAKKISDVCSGIKDTYGHKGPLAKEHLTYLCDLDYVKKETVMTKVTTGQTTRDQAKHTYRIAAKGIEYMEGKSDFSDRERYPGINVTATGGSSSNSRIISLTGWEAITVRPARSSMTKFGFERCDTTLT